MPNLATYHAIQDDPITLNSGGQKSVDFNPPNDIILANTGVNRPVLSYRVDPSNEANQLQFRVFIDQPSGPPVQVSSFNLLKSFTGLLGLMIALLLAACGGVSAPPPPTDNCSNTCIKDSVMLIGCDNRLVKSIGGGASTGPWGFTGRFDGGSKCSGTLIADKFVLTAAHCMLNQGNAQLGFALAQEVQGFNGRPYGTYGVRRVYIPSLYVNSDSETNRAYDYAVAELWEPIDGATPANWEYVSWNTLRNLAAFTVGYPTVQPDNGFLGRPWSNLQGYHATQPFRFLGNGEAGLLYTYLDGAAGQSGSPVYSYLPSEPGSGVLVPKVIGVLIGSPVAACQNDQNWVARLTPGAVGHIENVIDPNVFDFWWNIINIPTSPISGPGEAWP